MLDFFRKRINISTEVKSAIVYILANIINRGLALLTVPIFTRIMTMNQIGQVNLYNSWYGLISNFATLSLTSGGFSVAMKEYKDERDQYLSSLLTLTSTIALIIAIIYFIKPVFWNKLTGLPTKLMILILIGLLVTPARDFWYSRQRYEYKYKLFCIISISSAIIATIFSVSAVIYINQPKINVEARLFSNYLIVYGVAFCLWIYIFVKGKRLVNINYWKFSLSLSVPLIGYSIASQILSTSDRIMISKMVNQSAVGIYGTIYSISSVFTLIWTAVNASFVPYLYQNIDKKENVSISNISFALISAYALISIFLVLVAPEIVKILASIKYYEAIYIMPPIAVGVFFSTVSNLYSNILLYLKSSKYIMYASIIAAITNIGLNYVFIEIYGYMAAAYTTMICYILITIILAFWANKKFKENGDSLNRIYYNKKIFFLCITVTTILLLGLLLYHFTIYRYM